MKEAVLCSLMVLKALTYAPTGGIVASPTTSLPEQLSGTRNWGLPLLLAARCDDHPARVDECRVPRRSEGVARLAAARRRRLAATAADHLRPCRRTPAPRVEVDWLPGYEASRPVRVGNAAHEQLQIDVFGEVMDALHQARRGGIEADDSEWPFQKALLAHLAEIWTQPDEGIWEVRGGRSTSPSRR